MNGTARIDELVLLGGKTAARISCDPALVPSPGRYTLAREPATGALLASALFLGASHPGGFVAAPPVPPAWGPGSELNLRGPLGRGFTLPRKARRVALVACTAAEPARLLPLAEIALCQESAVTLVCDDLPDQLPLQLEVQPGRALREVCSWCDYAAYDVELAALGDLIRRLNGFRDLAAASISEVLVRTPMPCGGLADCGVCTIRTPDGSRLACLDGPVFEVRLLLGKT
jgi:hypothetical protein